MLTPFVFKSEQGHSYLYYPNGEGFLYITPVMAHLCALFLEQKWETKEEFRKYVFNQDSTYRFPRRTVVYNISKTFVFWDKYLLKQTERHNNVKPHTFESVKRAAQYLNHIVFEITEKCNLNCQYCGYGDLYDWYDKRENKDLPFVFAKNLLDYLEKNIWIKFASSKHKYKIFLNFYGGEPLLCVDLVKKIIAYANNLNQDKYQFIFLMTSNGLLLDKHRDFLVENKISLSLSLDGNDQHSSYRVSNNGKPSFEQVIKNINELQKLHPDYFSKYVSFISVIHHKNSAPEVVSFIKENYKQTPKLSELAQNGLNENKIEIFKDIYKNLGDGFSMDLSHGLEKELFAHTPQGTKLINLLKKHSTTSIHELEKLLKPSSSNDTDFATGTCSPLSSRLFLTVNGKILPCEHVDYKHVLGKVTDHEVILDYNHIARYSNELLNSITSSCTHCSCHSACPVCYFQLYSNDKREHCKSRTTFNELKANHVDAITLLEKHPSIYKRILA